MCALALEGAGWEPEAALALLRGFQVDKAPELDSLMQVSTNLQVYAPPN